MAVTYYLGVDGGTTRTKAVIGDDAGHIVGSGEGSASNYQVVGLEAAMSGITDAVQGALTAADLSISQIECAVFGLSGMDLPMHRETLDAALTTTFPGLIFDLSLIHISEPTRLGMISYAVFCLKKKKREKKQVPSL